MDKKISCIDKMIILKNAGWKVLRGLGKRFLLRKVKGIFLVGRNVQITHGRHIICGKNVKFEDYAEIHGLCKEGLIFNDYVTIGRDVMIRPSSYYGGDLGDGVIIGVHSSIGAHSYIGCSGKIVIGENVMIGPKCSLFAENHVFRDRCNSIKSQGVVRKGIVIEDDCWIGSNCVILDGVTIGKGSVIGAGTLVAKNVLPGTIIIDKRNREVKVR